MDFSSLSFIRLKDSHPLKPFDCGDVDLTDFFNNDCKHYLRELLAVTYIIENNQETIAFFSVLNDKITITDVDEDSPPALPRPPGEIKYKWSFTTQKGSWPELAEQFVRAVSKQ